MSKVEEHRRQIAARLGDPPTLTFPDGWKLSGSWRRAQEAPSQVGAVNPAEFDVLLGYADDDGIGKHRVLFALADGECVAECDCEGHRWNDWCAHVALLWWKWSRDDLAVTDLDTGRTYLSPPWWLSVDDVEADRVDAETSRPAVADGGESR